MIIPIRCFTCGQLLASKYKRFQELLYSDNLVLKKDTYGNEFLESTNNLKSFSQKNVITIKDRKKFVDMFLKTVNEKKHEFTFADRNKPPQNIEARILRQVGLKRYCCKRHFIGHVDILDKL